MERGKTLIVKEVDLDKFKLRGKAIITGEWIYCNPFSPFCMDVIPETLGRSTGLRDKNGRLIYEGDICLLYRRKYEIRWKDGGFGSRDYPPCADADGCIFSDTVPFTNRRYLKEILNAIDVVGTIHDNPDDGWPVTPQGKPLPKGIKTWEWQRNEQP